MSTMSIYAWLVKYNYGGFSVDGKRVERGENLARSITPRLQIPNRITTETSASKTIRSYSVEWKISPDPSDNSAVVTPSCTCADWLQSGGWTEKRLCKHQLALSMVTDIPSVFQPLTPKAHTAQEASQSSNPQSATCSPAVRQPSFSEVIASTIDQTINEIAAQVMEVLEQGLVPLLVGPTGCGKTSAIRRVASELSWRLVEHAGSDSYTDSDLVGVMMPSGLRMPGPVAQALSHARELEEPVLLFLDEFTRYHMRAQESLMRLLLPISSNVAASLGFQSVGAIRATSAPFWGDEWAPALTTHIALACNPWGNPLDPALVRRTVPVIIEFSTAIPSMFSTSLYTAIKLSWQGTQDGTLPLPLEYGELVRAEAPDDTRILDRYRLRLSVLDPAARIAFDALLSAAGAL